MSHSYDKVTKYVQAKVKVRGARRRVCVSRSHVVCFRLKDNFVSYMMMIRADSGSAGHGSWVMGKVGHVGHGSVP